MKANIHPKWYPEASVKCACGNTFTVGATVPEITVEVCSNCHPFYTGQMKYVDTAGRVDAFKEKRKKAKDNVLSKREKRRLKKQKRIRKELEKPESLEELREKLVKKSKRKVSKKTRSKKQVKKSKSKSSRKGSDDKKKKANKSDSKD